MKKLTQVCFILAAFTFAASGFANTLSWQRVDEQNNTALLTNTPNGTIFTSTDNCKTWQNHPAKVVDQTGAQYEITSNLAGVQKLPKGATTPIVISEGLPGAIMALTLAADASGKNIYLATDSGVFKLAYNADSWSPMAFSQQSNQFLFLLNPHTDMLYLYNKNSGIYALSPKSTTWKLIDDNEGFLPFSAQYASGTPLSINAMAVRTDGKLCVQTNWGTYAQK